MIAFSASWSSCLAAKVDCFDVRERWMPTWVVIMNSLAVHPVHAVQDAPGFSVNEEEASEEADKQTYKIIS